MTKEEMVKFSVKNIQVERHKTEEGMVKFSEKNIQVRNSKNNN